MNSTKRSVILILTILLIPSPVIAGGVGENHIFFDLSTEGFFGLQSRGPAGFSELAEDLESFGYIVNDNFMSNSNFGYLAEPSLHESDIVVIINPKRSLDNIETLYLMNFVENGGNLIVICDSPDSVFNSNLILDPYDIYFKREYLLNTHVNISSNKSINLGYSIPLDEWEVYTGHPKEFDENPLRLKGISEVSRDLFSEEISGEEYTILMAKNFQQGKVIALGNKDFLTNYRFNENKELLYFILNYIECEDEEGMQGLSYNPSELYIPLKDGKISFVGLSLENKNNKSAAYVSVEIPGILKDVVVPVESNFTIGPDEILDLNFPCQNLSSEYWYIKTKIALKVRYNEFSEPCIYKIPIEVVRK
ncbi:hypothetical protein MSMTP_0853 [Methanosarcina sp. MTP4]|uniref:DUF4350 domain-containing protein n=1 Tax=Methanosarcina sp. MTP4 TaxID=1434100 RepID=UPI000615FAC3|nr:DUF4350 domain-containing protein [Methanosarcina sp. MTP4]AKB24322.1 hypothetical protein MSMTP_0853 [Methanosarcina sp. MTP4]